MLSAPRHTLKLFHLLLTLPLTSLLLTTTLSSRPHSYNNNNAPFNDSKKYEGSSTFVHLRYHMGPVLTSDVTIHLIWYGSSWSPFQKRIVRSFIRSISPENPLPHPTVSNWWTTTAMYSDQTGSNVTRIVRLGREKNDRRCSYGKMLTRMTVQDVIKDAVTIGKNPLPIDAKGGIYLVLTSDDVGMQDFCSSVCGFHYFTFPSKVGYTLPYAWIGNSGKQCPGMCAYPFAITSFPGNAPRNPEKAPNNDTGVDGMISVIGHELAEIASNPLANAWYAGTDPSFPTEIADLCEGIYGTGGGGAYTGQMLTDGRSGAAYNLNGVGGRKFLVQWIWDPVLSYCVGPNAIDQ